MAEAQQSTTTEDDRTAYIEEMLTAFERSNPGVAEVMALYQDAVTRYTIATGATPTEVNSRSSDSTSDSWL
jgi:hypothetical protein